MIVKQIVMEDFVDRSMVQRKKQHAYKKKKERRINSGNSVRSEFCEKFSGKLCRVLHYFFSINCHLRISESMTATWHPSATYSFNILHLEKYFPAL